jgi:hypothetical protein
VAAGGQVDGCEHEVWHRRVEYGVLCVETRDFGLVGGEDDVVVVEAGFGEGGSGRHLRDARSGEGRDGEDAFTRACLCEMEAFAFARRYGEAIDIV